MFFMPTRTNPGAHKYSIFEYFVLFFIIHLIFTILMVMTYFNDKHWYKSKSQSEVENVLFTRQIKGCKKICIKCQTIHTQKISICPKCNEATCPSVLTTIKE